MSDFRLEEDDEGQYAHVQEGVEEHRHHAHVEGAHNALEHQEGHQDQHDVEDGGVGPDAADEEKDDGGHHQDVQNVGPAKAEKTEYGDKVLHHEHKDNDFI